MRACDPSLTLQHQVGSVEGSGDPASPASPENRSGYGQGHPWAGGGGSGSPGQVPRWPLRPIFAGLRWAAVTPSVRGSNWVRGQGVLGGEGAAGT